MDVVVFWISKGRDLVTTKICLTWPGGQKWKCTSTLDEGERLYRCLKGSERKVIRTEPTEGPHKCSQAITSYDREGRGQISKKNRLITTDAHLHRLTQITILQYFKD